MKSIKIFSGCLAVALLSGCASTEGLNGPRGPRIVASGRSTEYEQYAQVGVEFSSLGDFVAFATPSRWKSPVSTGGSLSWINPVAWSDDAGRTGRILIGEAIIIGGVAVGVAATSGGGSGGSGGSDAGGAGTPAPPPPSGPPSSPF